MLGDLVTVGASGSIFGLLGALFAYFLRNRALAQSGPQLLLISSLLAFNIVLGLDEGGMVDNSGHLAGFAAGVWLGWSTCPQWKVRLLLCVRVTRTKLERLVGPPGQRTGTPKAIRRWGVRTDDVIMCHDTPCIRTNDVQCLRVLPNSVPRPTVDPI